SAWKIIPDRYAGRTHVYFSIPLTTSAFCIQEYEGQMQLLVEQSIEHSKAYKTQLSARYATTVFGKYGL
ncbi:MAG: hypothetical protein ACI9GW_003317, partial [Halieaceae bacterium]